MKRLWLKLFLISFIWGQGTQTNRTGDPSKLPQPGGYIGISYEFDTKNKKKDIRLVLDLHYHKLVHLALVPICFLVLLLVKDIYQKKINLIPILIHKLSLRTVFGAGLDMVLPLWMDKSN